MLDSSKGVVETYSWWSAAYEVEFIKVQTCKYSEK
jgi:hypothetical protein